MLLLFHLKKNQKYYSKLYHTFYTWGFGHTLYGNIYFWLISLARQCFSYCNSENSWVWVRSFFLFVYSFGLLITFKMPSSLFITLEFIHFSTLYICIYDFVCRRAEKVVQSTMVFREDTIDSLWSHCFTQGFWEGMHWRVPLATIIKEIKLHSCF